jgi:hypothetical protein
MGAGWAISTAGATEGAGTTGTIEGAGGRRRTSGGGLPGAGFGGAGAEAMGGAGRGDVINTTCKGVDRREGALSPDASRHSHATSAPCSTMDAVMAVVPVTLTRA